MANEYDTIPAAVASIVTTHGHRILNEHDKKDIVERKLLAFTDKLTRTMIAAVAGLDTPKFED